MAGKDKDWVDYFGADYNISKPNAENDVAYFPKSNRTLYENVTELGYSNFTSDDFCSSNHSHVYLNVTCEFPINYAEPMYG